MIVLALDTALEACSVAVVQGPHTLAAHCEPMLRGHQERLAPMVAETMAQAGVAFADLDRIAVTVGPGSFTGLRVGLAFAKALSLALDIPCVGVGTLEALVASRPDTARAPLVVAALDARRDHVYVQAFSMGAPMSEPANLSLQEARRRLAALGVHALTPVVGSGAALLYDGEPTRQACDIDPAALATLAAARPNPDRRPQPLYLRAPDAKTIAERALAKAG